MYPYQLDLKASYSSDDQLASAFLDSGTKSSYGNSVGTDCANIDICPDFLIGAIFAAGAAAFLLFYLAITKAGRRKKRNVEQFPMMSQVKDVLYQGTVSFLTQLRFNIHTQTKILFYIQCIFM